MSAQGSVGFRWGTITGPYHANFSQVETQKFDPHWFYCLQWGCNNLFCQECMNIVMGDMFWSIKYLRNRSLNISMDVGSFTHKGIELHVLAPRFRPGCQAHRVQAGGGSVHVWGTFHNSAKSPLVLPDGYLTGVLYRGILQSTLVPFARHYFGDNYRYQDDNATPHRARVVLDFLQQGNVTKMEQPPRSPDCNPIEHLWDELGRAISSMDNPPQNLDELRQALLDKWAQIPVQRLQRLVAGMPRRLAAIIAARGGNTRYWPGTHKTRPPGSVTKKIIFVRPNLPQLSSSDM